ncbi:MAG: Fis family transcriptional regulator [Symploca sp. SIO3C6]|uniref:Fis family transcriptional regulator n=1 Tax=Symploca sp. SIO1C4 TaxID=2607765 RepID=A0A6B3NIJ7_9CYAN|nr:Fis family transcriptional regulator [Symploca sp. SIO3C6]NER30352.1 Fis family transcriptional regulator [Symploca sp. SIO1C4]NET05916.1 Fis family transcriptional regulator [Symploca sp. SIO2B6]NET49750.1 Fis family transcriptional regulator [Merismopedia sp. SIO2A8]
MTENFDAPKNYTQEAASEMDSLHRDRFELLSAYIDGEVTAAERSYVRHLLATDSDMQRLHARLMKLRCQLQSLPVPPTETTAQETAQAVIKKINRRRRRQTITWGGGAIAALFVCALSGIIPGGQSPQPALVEFKSPEVPSEPLMIAVNRPVIPIPKTAAYSTNILDAPTVKTDSD